MQSKGSVYKSFCCQPIVWNSIYKFEIFVQLNNNFESNLKLKEQTDEFNKSYLNTGPSLYDLIKLLQEKDK